MLDKENLIKWLKEDIKVSEKYIENPITDEKMIFFLAQMRAYFKAD